MNDFLKIYKTKEFISALELDYNDATKKIVVVDVFLKNYFL
jgi:hypothetical protein